MQTLVGMGYVGEALDELPRREALEAEAVSRRQAAVADAQRRIPLLQQECQQLMQQQQLLDTIAYQLEITKVAAENHLVASRRRLAERERDCQATLAAAAQLDKGGGFREGRGPYPWSGC